MVKRIFIIEDDENILYGLQDRFTSDGFEVDISTADEELEDLMARLRKYRPHFVVLDLLLPKLDGLEIVKRVKNDEEISESQVLIFTDLSDEDSKARSVGLGINHYFLKSEMDINEFADRVGKIVEGKTEDNNEISAAEEEVEEEEDDLVLE